MDAVWFLVGVIAYALMWAVTTEAVYRLFQDKYPKDSSNYAEAKLVCAAWPLIWAFVVLSLIYSLFRFILFGKEK